MPTRDEQILELFRQGETQRSMAEALGISEARVSQLVKRLKIDVKTKAKLRLEAQAESIVDCTARAIHTAADRGDARDALELLDRLDIAPRKRDPKESGAKVMIVVGGAPAPTAFPQLPGVSLGPVSRD